MNLIYFIRLCYKQFWLILGMACLLAGAVYYLTEKQAEAYTTSTTIYTGNQGGVNQSDNLINIVRSRETLEKTAIRLMAQHLLLDKPDPRYCLPETWTDLVGGAPVVIRQLAITLQLADRQADSDTLTQIEQYRTSKVFYAIKAGDSPARVAEKFGLTLEELEALNDPMPPFYGGEKLVVGTITEPYWVDTLMVGKVRPPHQSLYDQFVSNLTKIKNADQENYLVKTLNSSNKYYGIAKIATVRADRLNGSDLIKLTYESDDPAVCMQTLMLLTDVVREEARVISIRQTGRVTEYFQERLDAAKKQIDSLELDLMQSRIDSEKLSEELVPIGSQIERLEREIDLAQQDYMNHLNNLNESIQKQNKSEYADIQIIDSPNYPVKPNPSKRIVFIVAAFIAGIILSVSLIALFEYLDNSIKFPERLEKYSGLDIFGSFPKIPEEPSNRINYPLISSKSVDQLALRISLEEMKQKNRGNMPYVIFIISAREDEGKTFVASRVIEKLRASGSKVLFVKPKEKETPAEEIRKFTRFDQPAQAWDYEYDVPDNIISIKNINELLRNYSFLTKGFNYLVIELPALLHRDYPAYLLESGDLSLFVCLATRKWKKADNEAIRLYQSTIKHPLMAVLNACHPDRLESVLGDIPKRKKS